MNKRSRIALLLAFLTILVAAIAWQVERHSHSFHGKSESYWIYSLELKPSSPAQWNAEYDEQQHTWESFGSEGIPILFKALQLRPGPAARVYSRAWHKLPPRAQNLLPTPVNYQVIRIRASMMLYDVALQHHPIPIQRLLSLTHDDDTVLRINSVSLLDNVILTNSGPEKEQALPSLIRATTDSWADVRMFAVHALRFFPEDAQVIVPVLTNALKDQTAVVRIRAADALYKIDPSVARKADVANITLDCVRNPGAYDHIANLPQQFFQELLDHSEFSTDILIHLLYDQSETIRLLSADALGKAGPSAAKAVPYLSGVMQNDHAISVRDHAAAALKAIDPAAFEKAQTH